MFSFLWSIWLNQNVSYFFFVAFIYDRVLNLYSTESVACNFEIEIIFVCIHIQYTHKSTHAKKKKKEYEFLKKKNLSQELKATNNGLWTWLNKWLFFLTFHLHSFLCFLLFSKSYNTSGPRKRIINKSIKEIKRQCMLSSV